MWSNIKQSFGILDPIALLILPLLLGFLVYIYLRRGRGKKIIVASVMILKELRKFSSSRKKFTPPLRFFLELLLLSLLTLALARPYYIKSAEQVTILIDNSQSMGQLNLADQNNQNLFSLAKIRAKNLISKLSSTDFVDLWQTSPVLKKVSESVAPKKALAQLDQIALEFAADNLESAVTRLSQDKNTNKIYLFSDRQLQIDEKSSDRIIAEHLLSESAADLVNNLAITDISSVVSSQQPKEQELRVEVSSFSKEAANFEVTLEVWEQGQFRRVAKRSVSLEPAAVRTLEFKVPAQDFGGYRAHLVLAAGRAALLQNRLAADDWAYLGQNLESSSLTLVSELDAKQLGLDQISGVKILHQLPQNYSTAAASPDLYIFHRYLPPELPAASSLFVFPPVGKGFFDVAQGHLKTEITDWELSHPVLNYLNLPLLKLKNSVSFVLPNWGEKLISTTDGHLAFFGENQGRKYLALGFELFPYQGKQSALLSIFLLNSLKWLAEISIQRDYATVNTVLNFRESDLLIKNASGQVIDSAGIGQGRFVFNNPGLYQINSALGKRLQAVDFFSKQESDLIGSSKPVLSQLARVDPRETKNQQSLIKYLAYFVLIVLLLDLIWLLRSRRKLGVVL